MDEFAFLDATAQADLVRRKQVKPIELVDAAIERIARLNPALNAVVTPMYDIAREAASGPLPEGPFPPLRRRPADLRLRLLEGLRPRLRQRAGRPLQAGRPGHPGQDQHP